MGIGVLAPGMMQQTAAVKVGIAKAAGRRGGLASARKRRNGKKKRAAPAARRKSGGGKRKYNNAAWMAKIRKLRGKGKKRK